MTHSPAIARTFQRLANRRAVASRPLPALFRPWPALRWLDRLNQGEALVNVVSLGMVLSAVVAFAVSALVKLLQVPALYEAWVVWVPTVLMAGLAVRSALMALRWGPVTLEQLGHIQSWMANSPGLSQAVSNWIRPGQPFLQGDYLAIRHAAAFEKRHSQGRSLAQASSPAPQWLSTLMNRFHHRATVPTSSTQNGQVAGKVNPFVIRITAAPQKALLAWQSSMADNLSWIVNKRAAVTKTSSWPSGLLPEETQRLQAIEDQWNKRRAPSTPFTARQVQAWTAKWFQAPSYSIGQRREGLNWWKAWLRPAAWAGFRGWAMSGAFLFIVSELATVQSRALELPTSKEDQSLVGAGVIRFLELLEDSGEFLWVFALAVGVFSALHIALTTLPMWRLRASWWTLPLSPAGRRRLDQELSNAPALFGPFVAQLGTTLTQADLAFVQEASKVLERHHRQAQEAEDQQKNTAAMDSLPAMAAYKARVLEAALPPAQAAPARPRL